MITITLLLIPFLAGILLLAVKSGNVKKLALTFAVIEFAVAVVASVQFQKNADMQFAFSHPWITSLGINFHVAMDGISLLLVLLTTLLVPLIILTSFHREIKNASVFFSLILFMQFALVGVFTAMDGFLFYIFWELALIPIWFICLLWGGDNRVRITFKFFVYTLLGSLFMLVALIYVYLHTNSLPPIGGEGQGGGYHSFDINSLYTAGKSLSAKAQSFVFLAMFLAFAIKMPVFPFHTWQPDTYVTAPAQGTMLLSGIMLKMGTYGLIRWLLPIAPAGFQEWGTTAILLSVAGIIYASCMAIVQQDFKRLIAYSSIAHVGLISAGILVFNVQGIQGGVMQMLAHGINVVGLFFIVDIIYHRTNTREISSLGGIRNINPQFATLFLIVLLGSVALPLTNGFVGEFLLINGIYQYSAWTAAFAGLTVILGAVYMLRSYQGIMLGETNTLTEKFSPLAMNEKIVLIIICALIIVMGVYPKPLLDISEPAVKMLIEKHIVSLN